MLALAPAVGWLARIAPYGLVAFLYVATWPYHAGLNNPNELVRVYMTKAIVDHGSMAIGPVLAQWGGVDDKATRDGKLYSSKAPLQSLIGVPAYALIAGAKDKRFATTWLRIFTAAIPGFALAIALIAWCRRRALELDAPIAAGTGVGLALALGTMLYPYAITFTGHALAAVTAGGCYMACTSLLRRDAGSSGWRRIAVIAGFLGGAAPFAEYPAALIAAPALVGAFAVTRGWSRRAELVGWLALGGAAPFGLGLWAHNVLWGSPFSTGYSFLENNAYVEVHGSGFFGVKGPSLVAFAGSLFSSGTGLFFFSPILAIGLLAMVMRLFRRDDERGLPRVAAITGLVGFILSVLFISGHTGWRGGWTVGPRYIIGVAPVLGLWVIEGSAVRWMRPLIAPLAAVSVIATGFAAALYPHLSDVYTNPLVTFLWPSYLRGDASYGIAHTLGLVGGTANLVHIIPLAVASLFCGLAAGGSLGRRAIILAVTLVVSFGGMTFIPENDVSAALRENERLWGFWEPSRPRMQTPGLIFRARDRWRIGRVESQIIPDGRKVPCRWQADRCDYGGMPWQHYGPDFVQFDGKLEPVLFLHPIKDWIVRARFMIPSKGIRATLRYGMADASADSDNPEPVTIVVKHADDVVRTLTLQPQRGLQTFEFSLVGRRGPIELEVTCKQDGARVLGFDIDVFEAIDPVDPVPAAPAGSQPVGTDSK